MKLHRAALAASLFCILLCGAASAQETLKVYAAKGTFRGYLQNSANGDDVLTPWRLNTSQFVDLVLGLPLTHKVPPNIVLAVAGDYSREQTGDPTAPKELIVVDTFAGTLLTTVIISNTNSVCNAQNTRKGFKRLGFGVGNIQASGNTNFGTTGGLVQMTGVLERKQTNDPNNPITPVLTQTVVGSFDIYLGGSAGTFFCNSGVLTASGRSIGTLEVN